MKEWLYQETMKISRKTDSSVLKANAWHHRVDALSAIVALVGVSGRVCDLSARLILVLRCSLARSRGRRGCGRRGVENGLRGGMEVAERAGGRGDERADSRVAVCGAEDDRLDPP